MSKWDVFVSHASEDKKDIVEPLVHALEGAGIRVWYDKSALKVGDRLRRSIDEGLKSSRFGIVVLSHHYFGKDWAQAELDGLIQQEIGRATVLLPLWVDVTFDEVRAYSPMLVDRLAASWSDGLPAVVRLLVDAMRAPVKGSVPAVGGLKSLPKFHDELVLVLSPEGKTVFLAAQEVVLGEDVRLTIAVRDAEEAAFLAGLRGSRGRMGVAYGSTAQLGTLESATQSRRGSKDVWTVTIGQLLKHFSESFAEMSYNGISADR